AVQRAAVGRIGAVEAGSVALDGVGGDGVAEVDRGRERAVDPAVPLLEPKAEVVVVVADPRARPLLVGLEHAVLVEVAHAVDAGAVRDGEVALERDDDAGLVVAAGELGVGAGG
ncbi:MAG: hypothetical protein ACK56I_27035, partial [bacterium]